jgi:hypothetical protein
VALKPNASNWTIKEQIIEDAASGLMLQFEIAPDGEPCLRIYGDALPFGNREVQFHRDGTEAGAGTATGLCRPCWMSSPDDL